MNAYEEDEKEVDNDCLETSEVAHGDNRQIHIHEVDPVDLVVLPVLSFYIFQELKLISLDELWSSRGMSPE